MIYTVFPKNPDEMPELMPQDFSTKEEAIQYGTSLNVDYTIESTEGEVV